MPVNAASTTLYNVVAIKEYKQWSSYNPSYTFSKSSSSVIQAMSTDPGFGNAYIYIPFDKDFLNGKKLEIYWRWYLDYNNYPATLSELYVVDHENDRRLINSGEFRTQGDLQHPITDYTYIPACSYSATSNGGWISWRTDISGVLDLSSFTSSIVSVMIRTLDPWIADTTGLQVDYLRVLDSNNQMVSEYHFAGTVLMQETSSYYDYGLLRNPTCSLWGTRDYPEEQGCPLDEEMELSLSQGVSNYISSIFYSSGKYPYLVNWWGANTEPGIVNGSVETCEAYYDFSIFFYKGHFWESLADPPECGVPDCPFDHKGVVDDEGYDATPVEAIKDYCLHAKVEDGKVVAYKTRGTHDFVFLWACMHGDPDWLGSFFSDHSSGMAASLMDIDNPSSELVSNCDHVFISFDWISPWYIQEAQDPTCNYGHFVAMFYNRLLNGDSIGTALDAASQFVNDGLDFDESELYTGIQVWNSFNHTWSDVYCHLRPYGDCTLRIPR